MRAEERYVLIDEPECADCRVCLCLFGTGSVYCALRIPTKDTDAGFFCYRKIVLTPLVTGQDK